MPLSLYEIPTVEIPIGKTSFKVRAITFPDLTMLVQSRLPDLIAIIAKYNDAQGDITSTKNIGELAMMITRDFPSLTTEIISACIYGEAVDEEMREKVAAIGIATQLNALLQIGKLSMEEGGGLGNLIAGFRQRLQDAAGDGSLTTPGTPSA